VLLDVVIPSKWRQAKLDATLNSIFVSLEHTDQPQSVRIYLYLTDAAEYQHYWSYFADMPAVIVKHLPVYRVPDFWNGHLAAMRADAMMYMNDDVQFYTDTLSLALRDYQLAYPQYDGVMGIKQANLPEGEGLQGAFGIIGRNYVKRFPGGQVWCPDYERFYADKELELYAKSIGKFKFNTYVRINHLHPAFGGTKDKTHQDVRVYLNDDRLTNINRITQGYLWGRNWNLVNSKDKNA
jgi:hypothetical protein